MKYLRDIREEVRYLNKGYNTFLHMFLLILFNNLLFYLVSLEGGQKLSFVLISVISSALNISYSFGKDELKNGIIEQLLSTRSTESIVIIRFAALVYLLIAAFYLSLPIISILYSFDLKYLGLLALTGSLIIPLLASFIILINSSNYYFRSNNGLIHGLMLVMLLPTAIICGLIFNSIIYWPTLGLLAVDLIIAPIAIILSRYLLANLYNY